MRIDGGRVLHAVLGREPGDRLRAHERRVAGQHEDVVLGVEIVEDRQRDAHRVAGAALHALLDELDRHLGDELVVQRLRDALGRVADDDDDAFERQLGERVDDVQHHRTTAQRVQHLRRPRTHPRAFPRGEDDCAQGSVLPHASSLLSCSFSGSGGGFRTSTQGFKGPCAAVTPPPNRHRRYAAAARADSLGSGGFW